MAQAKINETFKGQAILDDLMVRYPDLEVCREALLAAFNILKEAFTNGRKLLICGNGGSAADAEHISGELMKGFRKKRLLPEKIRLKIDESAPNSERIGALLQGALPAYPLNTYGGLITAIANDLPPDLLFAQQVWGYGSPGDVLLAISTSGNSLNLLNAVRVAKAKEMITLALTGSSGGKLKEAVDLAIRAPASETFKVQEFHVPLYHCLCAMLEEVFFD